MREPSPLFSVLTSLLISLITNLECSAADHSWIAPVLPQTVSLDKISETQGAVEISLDWKIPGAGNPRRVLTALGKVPNTFGRLKLRDCIIKQVQPGEGFTVACPAYNEEVLWQSKLVGLLTQPKTYGLNSLLDGISGHRITPLTRAVQHGDSELVKVFIGIGADVRKINEDGSTPLHHIRKFDKDGRQIAKALLAAGADVNAYYRIPYENPFESPVKTVLTTALEQDGDPLSIPYLLYLLEPGADPNVAPQNSWSPASVILNFNESDIAACVLIKFGVPPTSRKTAGQYADSESGLSNPKFETLQQSCDEASKSENFEELLPGVQERFHDALRANDIDEVDSLLTHGARVEEPIGNQRPLLSAINSNNIPLLSVLLKHNANPNLLGGDAWAPLVKAIQKGNVEAVEALLRYNVNIDIQPDPIELGKQRLEEDGITGEPIVYALFKKRLSGEPDAAKQLLHRIIRDKWFWIDPKADFTVSLKSAIDAAAKSNHAAQLGILLTANKFGLLQKMTAVADSFLFRTLKSCNLHALGELLKEGLNTNIRTATGETFLYQAVQRCEAKFVSTLLQYGADPNLRNTNRRNAYWTAEHGDNRNTDEFKAKQKVLLEYGAKKLHPIDALLTSVPVNHGLQPEALFGCFLAGTLILLSALSRNFEYSIQRTPLIACFTYFMSIIIPIWMNQPGTTDSGSNYHGDSTVSGVGPLLISLFGVITAILFFILQLAKAGRVGAKKD